MRTLRRGNLAGALPGVAPARLMQQASTRLRVTTFHKRPDKLTGTAAITDALPNGMTMLGNANLVQHDKAPESLTFD